MVDQVKFVDVCRVLERAENTRGSSKKQDILAVFFASIPALLTENAFPLLRLLVPKFDREKAYGISVKKLAALYVGANSWPAQGQKATRLFQWADNKHAAKASGISNFTHILESILREERFVQDSTWTVADVNQFLQELKDIANHAERVPLWQKISLQLTSAIEHKWLMRILLKDLKLGIGDNSILAMFHPSAVDWYNTTGDLYQVCTYASEHSNLSRCPSPKEPAVSISPNNPIRPMLAARVLWTDVEEQLKAGHWAVELKFDGERCLIHKIGSRFRFYSRNQTDLTEKYPDYLSAMEPILKETIVADSCILDGELVVWDDIMGGFAKFGTNRVAASGKMPNCHLAYVAFDIVSLNGNILTEIALHERRKMLEKCISKQTPHRFEISKQEIIDKPEQLMTALDHAIDQGNEGLVIKNSDSRYAINVRDKSYWMKVKADYLLSDAMCDTMDLIILGVYFGKRNSFLLGVSNPNNLDNQGYPRSFYTYLRCGSGFAQDELGMLLERLEPHYVQFDKNSPPSWFEPLPSQFTPPNVAIDPSNSCIIEIKGFEIQKSSKQSCGYTVRFPVAVRIRNDKLWYECWTLNDIISMESGPNRGRICYNVREKLLSASHHFKKAKKVLPSLPLHTIGKVDVKSTIFEGFHVHIRGGTSRCSTTEMQKLILSNGGELALNLTKETAKKIDLVLIGDETVQVRNLLQIVSQDPEFDIDVIRFQWALDSISRSELCRFFPWYCMHLSQETRTRMSSIMDVDTGIVWGNPPDVETCKQIYESFKSNSGENPKSVTNTSSRGLKRFRDQLGPVVYDILWTSSTFFRDVIAYCIPECSHAASHGIPCGISKMIGNFIKIYSGQTVIDYTANVTHIVTCDVPNFKWQENHDVLSGESLKSAKVVGKQWLDHCIQNQNDKTALSRSDVLYGRALEFQ